MKHLALSVAVVASLLFAAPAAADDKAIEAAKTAATEWLALVDKADTQGTYDTAAGPFKQQVSAEQWKGMLGQVSGQLGALQNREFTDAKYAAQTPGLGDTPSVQITYQSNYANLAGANEVIVLIRDEDGTWRAGGYFVQPGQ